MADDNDFETFADGDEESLMVNLSKVEATTFDAIPKGAYPVVVEECDFAISKSSGKPMWSVRFSVLEGEFENRKLFTYMSFSEKALGMTKTNIVALGLTELLEGAFDPRKVANEGIVVGKTAIAKVGVEEGQDGEPRNTVKTLKPMTSTDGFE